MPIQSVLAREGGRTVLLLALADDPERVVR